MDPCLVIDGRYAADLPVGLAEARVILELAGRVVDAVGPVVDAGLHQGLAR